MEGRCDLCGEACDPETQELNALDCTYAPKCPPECAVYHQDCLEKYLKNIRLEKCVLPHSCLFDPCHLAVALGRGNSRCIILPRPVSHYGSSEGLRGADCTDDASRNRKTGFKCPRGCGKESAFSQACPGKVASPPLFGLIFESYCQHCTAASGPLAHCVALAHRSRTPLLAMQIDKSHPIHVRNDNAKKRRKVRAHLHPTLGPILHPTLTCAACHCSS